MSNLNHSLTNTSNGDSKIEREEIYIAHEVNNDNNNNNNTNRIINLEGAKVLTVKIPTYSSLTSSGIPPHQLPSPQRFSQEDHCILLPYQTTPVSHFSLDIGGSLVKMVYFEADSAPDSHDSTNSSSDASWNGSSLHNGEEVKRKLSLPPVTVRSKVPSVSFKSKLGGGRLCFAKFETQNIGDAISFIKAIESQNPVPRQINATGGGAYKFEKRFEEELGITMRKVDEMESLITGLNFLLRNIPNESFTYSKHQERHFQTVNPDDLYPYLLVNIGSGVSMLKVTGDDQYERIGGSSLGGGTFWGLAHLLTKCDSFDEVLRMCQEGDHTKVDMLVGDIYGSDYSKIGLASTAIASSVGKTIRKSKDGKKDPFGPEDLAQSLLFMISNNIGSIAYLNAMRFNLKRIYFGGYFIRDHPITMGCISYAINFWSKGNMQALFLKHEGYLGAIGAFLIDQFTSSSPKKHNNNGSDPNDDPNNNNNNHVSNGNGSI